MLKRSFVRRFFTLLLAVLLTASMVSLSVQAVDENSSEGILYIDKIVSGDNSGVTSQTSYLTGEVYRITKDDTKWGEYGTDTWYVLDSDVELDEITIEGKVHIILCDQKTLRINHQINHMGNRNSEIIQHFVSPYTGREYDETVRVAEKTCLYLYAQSEDVKTMGTFICETENDCIVSENDISDIYFNGGNIILKGKNCIKSGGFVDHIYFNGGNVIFESTDGNCICSGNGLPVHSLYFLGSHVTMDAPCGSCICGTSQGLVDEYLFEGEGADRHYVGSRQIERAAGYVRDLFFNSGSVMLTSRDGCINGGMNDDGLVEFVYFNGGSVLLSSSDSPCISAAVIDEIRFDSRYAIYGGSDLNEIGREKIIYHNGYNGQKYIAVNFIIPDVCSKGATCTENGYKEYYYDTYTGLYYQTPWYHPTEIGDEAALENWKNGDGCIPMLDHPDSNGDRICDVCQIGLIPDEKDIELANAERLFAQAQEYESFGEYMSAAEDYDKASESYSFIALVDKKYWISAADASAKAGDCYLKAGDYSQAMTMFDFASAYYHLGENEELALEMTKRSENLTGSVLSGGSIWIIVSCVAAAAVLVAALVIVKKKKPAPADGADKDEA